MGFIGPRRLEAGSSRCEHCERRARYNAMPVDYEQLSEAIDEDAYMQFGEALTFGVGIGAAFMYRVYMVQFLKDCCRERT
jgi:hypothetical protein